MTSNSSLHCWVLLNKTGYFAYRFTRHKKWRWNAWENMKTGHYGKEILGKAILIPQWFVNWLGCNTKMGRKAENVLKFHITSPVPDLVSALSSPRISQTSWFWLPCDKQGLQLYNPLRRTYWLSLTATSKRWHFKDPPYMHNQELNLLYTCKRSAVISKLRSVSHSFFELM